MKTILAVWLFIMAVTYFGIFVMGSKKDKPIILKQTTDNRGLTSVMFTEGKDTFALDYLTKKEYDSVFVCPDCGETGCIYEDIDSRIIEGTDIEISNAIYQVCKERNITDSTAIAWLKGDYYQ